MKTRIVTLLVLVSALSIVSAASADDTPNVHEVSEEVDAWLHAHCAYEGAFVTKDERTRLLDGEVAVVVTSLGDTARLVKRFACKEKPAFYTEAFVPVRCDKLPEKEKVRCEVKFPPPPPAVVQPALAPAPPPADASPNKGSASGNKSMAKKPAPAASKTTPPPGPAGF